MKIQSSVSTEHFPFSVRTTHMIPGHSQIQPPEDILKVYTYQDSKNHLGVLKWLAYLRIEHCSTYPALLTR